MQVSIKYRSQDFIIMNILLLLHCLVKMSILRGKCLWPLTINETDLRTSEMMLLKRCLLFAIKKKDFSTEATVERREENRETGLSLWGYPTVPVSLDSHLKGSYSYTSSAFPKVRGSKRVKISVKAPFTQKCVLLLVLFTVQNDACSEKAVFTLNLLKG